MTGQDTAKRYDIEDVKTFATALFKRAGLDDGKADAVARILLEADLMGHATHGLALAPWYLDEAVSGSMSHTGEPDVVSDRGACVTWKGKGLPGAWLTEKAMILAVERAATYGTVTVAISNSHHIGALAAYLPRATERGYMALLACSTASAAGVAPFGGRKAIFTPNPMAAGIPTDGAPILLDISASITTLNRAKQMASEGRHFPHPWVLDADGMPTDDPAAVISQGGTLLPVGGLDHGHKGYSWALLVEALTQGLAGFGRSDHPTGQSLSVFLQIIDPSAFGGASAFTRQTSWLTEACASCPPRPGVDRVRIPGEQALVRRREAILHGVPLSSQIIEGLRPWAERSHLAMPLQKPA
ncbi:Ldh family oxidoreductase [Telmatospirillum sp.]|uniref:Ldh family oxidoreductase n=1 Tax=Telmatospirillum sp. TaxID=2079197 RepID=UPI0028484CC7|nr:Ldh family oxidoreductase [Telmatospirillum sp.]MDR3439221.1 Ldh family oxidoreductase [Telmatospirillum sp.]